MGRKPIKKRWNLSPSIHGRTWTVVDHARQQRRQLDVLAHGLRRPRAGSYLLDIPHDQHHARLAPDRVCQYDTQFMFTVELGYDDNETTTQRGRCHDLCPRGFTMVASMAARIKRWRWPANPAPTSQWPPRRLSGTATNGTAVETQGHARPGGGAEFSFDQTTITSNEVIKTFFQRVSRRPSAATVPSWRTTRWAGSCPCRATWKRRSPLRWATSPTRSRPATC